MCDAHRLVLIDFGEAFAPAREKRLGKDCYISVMIRPPETFFKPNAPLSYPIDILALGMAIWEIIGMKPLFGESEPADEIVAEQLDVLGSDHFPSS